MDNNLAAFPVLPMPTFEKKISTLENKMYIWDVIRKKNVVLTPEEWVRQHIIHLLLSHYEYPKSLFRLESGLIYNKLEKRSDILVYDRSGTPFLLIECKAADVKIDQSVLEQVTRYNKIVKAPYISLTNGFKTFCFELQGSQTTQLPYFPKLPPKSVLQT